MVNTSLDGIKEMLKPRSTFRMWFTRIVFMPIIIIPLVPLLAFELLYLSINAVAEWVAFGHWYNPLDRAEYATFWRK